MKYTLSKEMLAPAIANILRFAECRIVCRIRGDTYMTSALTGGGGLADT